MNELFKTAKKVVLVMVMVIMPTNGVLAATIDDKKNELSQIETQIKEIQGGLQEKQNQVRTLSDQLVFMDAQITTVQEQINILEGQIKKTNEEIVQTNAQIVEVQQKLSKQQELLKEYIVEIYSSRNTSTFEMIASSNNFSEYMNQAEYVEKIQEKINENVKIVKDLQRQLETKKKELDAQKSQTESLQKDQNQKKQALEVQKGEKQKILYQTKGEEANYQNMLADAREKEVQAQHEIQKMIQELNRSRRPAVSTQSGGYQASGAVIGNEGSTGYSTGSHLHFTVYRNGVEVDPLPLLQSGTLAWPENGAIITQYYGIPNWNAAYSFHNGIDMSGGYGNPIHMAAPGVVVTDAWMPNGYGHYKIVDHGNGLMTLYGHMQ